MIKLSLLIKPIVQLRFLNIDKTLNFQCPIKHIFRMLADICIPRLSNDRELVVYKSFREQILYRILDASKKDVNFELNFDFFNELF